MRDRAMNGLYFLEIASETNETKSAAVRPRLLLPTLHCKQSACRFSSVVLPPLENNVVDVQYAAQLSGWAAAAKLAMKLVTLEHLELKPNTGIATVLGFDVGRHAPWGARKPANLTCRLWPCRTGRTGCATLR